MRLRPFNSLNDRVLKRTLFRFGHFHSAPFGFLTFGEDGKVRSYHHDNETNYSFFGNKISFLNSNGKITSTLVKVGSSRFYAQPGFQGLYLAPLLTLDPPKQNRLNAKILINSIPKSGTHLVDRTLQEIGFISSYIHLGNGHVDDNRGISDAEIHRGPGNRRILCSPSALCDLLAPGEIAMGHIDDLRELNKIRNNGITIINCVRDLRDALISRYHFSKTRVPSDSSTDKLWRTLPAPSDFIGFLIARFPDDITVAKEVARSIIHLGGPRIRFEDLIAGILQPSVSAMLDEIEPRLSSAFQVALSKSINAHTATLSSKRADYKEYWDDDIQCYFDEMGLTALNNALGYV